MARYRRNASGRGLARVGLAIATVVAAASLVPVAFAGHKGSSTYGYGGASTPAGSLAPATTKAGAPPSTHGPTTATAVTAPSGSTLPFTGVDLALIAAAGVVLAVAGAGVRGVARRPGRNG